MVARQCCASRRKERRSLLSTATLPQPRRPRCWRQSPVANASPSRLMSRARRRSPPRWRRQSSAGAASTSCITTSGSGSAAAIVNISSVAAYENTYPLVAYKATTAAMIAFTEQLALHNAPYGIRANCILPGLMDTPMAVDTRARASNRSRAEVAAERDARVPLRGKMGTGWDVANAALFLASDEANFITGVALPVDGGALVKVG